MDNFWKAGYHTVIAGSFLDCDTHSSLQEFRALLGQSVTLYVVHLVPITVNARRAADWAFEAHEQGVTSLG